MPKTLKEKIKNFKLRDDNNNVIDLFEVTTIILKEVRTLNIYLKRGQIISISYKDRDEAVLILNKFKNICKKWDEYVKVIQTDDDGYYEQDY